MQTIISYAKITVIKPHGSFNASNGVEFKHQMIANVVRKHYNKIVLVDLEQVESLDSAGLMALVYGLKLAQSLNRRFSLCSVSPSIKIIFELTQLDRVFEMFESREAFEAAIA